MAIRKVINGEAVNLDNGGGGGSITAANVNYDNTDSGLDATNAQDAIDEVKSDLSDVAHITKNTSVGNMVFRRVGNIINMKTNQFKTLNIGSNIIPSGFRPTESLFVPGALVAVAYANTYGGESQLLNTGNVSVLFNTTYIVD